MGRVKADAMRDQTPDEIRMRIAELREELFNLRFRNSMKQLDNALKIREGRREIARLLTVLGEGAQAGLKSPGSRAGVIARLEEPGSRRWKGA